MEGYSACSLLNLANWQYYNDGVIFKAHILKCFSQLDIILLLVALATEGYSACCILNITNWLLYNDGIAFKAHVYEDVEGL